MGWLGVKPQVTCLLSDCVPFSRWQDRKKIKWHFLILNWVGWAFAPHVHPGGAVGLWHSYSHPEGEGGGWCSARDSQQCGSSALPPGQLPGGQGEWSVCSLMSSQSGQLPGGQGEWSVCNVTLSQPGQLPGSQGEWSVCNVTLSQSGQLPGSQGEWSVCNVTLSQPGQLPGGQGEWSVCNVTLSQSGQLPGGQGEWSVWHDIKSVWMIWTVSQRKDLRETLMRVNGLGDLSSGGVGVVGHRLLRRVSSLGGKWTQGTSGLVWIPFFWLCTEDLSYKEWNDKNCSVALKKIFFFLECLWSLM